MCRVRVVAENLTTIIETDVHKIKIADFIGHTWRIDGLNPQSAPCACMTMPHPEVVSIKVRARDLARYNSSTRLIDGSIDCKLS